MNLFPIRDISPIMRKLLIGINEEGHQGAYSMNDQPGYQSQWPPQQPQPGPPPYGQPQWGPEGQQQYGQPQQGQVPPTQYAQGYGQQPVWGAQVATQKDWLTTLLLCIFLGGLGVHRFYTGHTAIGVVQL